MTLDELEKKIFQHNISYQIASGLRRARIERGLSQAQLAKLSGCKQPLISWFENEVRHPRPKSLAKILKALGYEIDVQFKKIN